MCVLHAEYDPVLFLYEIHFLSNEVSASKSMSVLKSKKLPSSEGNILCSFFWIFPSFVRF